jgi:putative hydrolase
MDDELPPDPFPGDPFADKPKNRDATPPAAPGGFDLGGLAGMFGGAQGPLGGLFAQFAGAGQQGFQYDVARHTAIWSAAGGEVEPNLDPVERIKYETLAREMFPIVRETLGIEGIATPTIEATTRANFAAETLSDLRPLFDAIAAGMSTPAPKTDSFDDEPSELAAIGQLMAMFGPMTTAPQVGAMLGELAKTALCSGDLLIPRRDARLVLVPANITAFASEWSMNEDTARSHVIIAGLAIQSVLMVPHVKQRLLSLLEAHAKATRIDGSQMTNNLQNLMGSLGGEDGIDFTALAQGDVSSLGKNLDPNNAAVKSLSGDRGIPGVVETPEQARIRRDIQTLLVPLIGVVDYAIAVAGARLLGDNRQVIEAWRRRRATPNDATKSIRLLLGCSLTPTEIEMSAAFVGGVMQRKGSQALQSLWANAEGLPTEAEVSAPGLWLARLGLDD